jgi:hypothetical protein
MFKPRTSMWPWKPITMDEVMLCLGLSGANGYGPFLSALISATPSKNTKIMKITFVYSVGITEWAH